MTATAAASLSDPAGPLPQPGPEMPPTPGTDVPQPPTPEITPRPPGPEMPPPRPAAPDLQPVPDSVPEPDAPDVGPTPPEEIPPAGPDLPPPSPGTPPGGPMIMTLAAMAALGFLAGAVLALGPGAASAQVGGTPPLGQAVPPGAAPPEVLETDPAQRPSDAAEPPPPGTNLSEQLSRSDGVIRPARPNVDPGMVEPAPDVNSTMPVIPPPGSPGGDPTVRPR